MVLSPIEPVAPRTVTDRTADAAALLLRNGTALIFSPNHKTAADAIGTTPQEPKNSSHNDGCDKPVQTIQQPAMTGNDVAGILDAETPLHGRLEEIAELGADRENRAQQDQRAGFAKIERGKSASHRQAGGKTANGARP